MQNFNSQRHPFHSASQSEHCRVGSALVPSSLRCLTTFLWIIARRTSALSLFWDYSSEHAPTFLMLLVDRLFLCFRWLQIWKPAKCRGWAQRFFELKVQMVWHLSSSNKTVIKPLFGKVGYLLIFFHFERGRGYRIFWPRQGDISPETMTKDKTPILVFASSSSPCVFAYVLDCLGSRMPAWRIGFRRRYFIL